MGMAESQVSTISGKSSDIDCAFTAAFAGAPPPSDQPHTRHRRSLRDRGRQNRQRSSVRRAILGIP